MCFAITAQTISTNVRVIYISFQQTKRNRNSNHRLPVEWLYIQLRFPWALSRNVQTTWRLVRQQLSVHSARNQVLLVDTNCRTPKRLEPQLAHWAGDVTHAAHRRARNELQEVHSSKLISLRPCDWFLQSGAEDFCHQEQLLTMYNSWPWNQSSSVTSRSREKVMTAPQGHVQLG